MKYDMSSPSFSDINTFVNSSNGKPVLKKLIRVGAVALVPIHEPLLKELHIDEACTWFEEKTTSEGILLKITRRESLVLQETGKECLS